MKMMIAAALLVAMGGQATADDLPRAGITVMVTGVSALDEDVRNVMFRLREPMSGNTGDAVDDATRKAKELGARLVEAGLDEDRVVWSCIVRPTPAEKDCLILAKDLDRVEIATVFGLELPASVGVPEIMPDEKRDASLIDAAKAEAAAGVIRRARVLAGRIGEDAGLHPGDIVAIRETGAVVEGRIDRTVKATFEVTFATGGETSD